MSRTVLAIGPEIAGLQALLSRRDFAVERLPRGRSALVVAGAAGFDLIIVVHPLADLALDVFLRELRQSGSPCERADLVVVTDSARMTEIAPLVEAARGTLCPREPPRRISDEVACRLLGVSPRLEARLLAKTLALVGTPTNRTMCQMVNLSTAGMLLRTDRSHPLGTRLRFEFGLPEDVKAIEGEAEVVRHAHAGFEGVEGVALKFVRLTGDSAVRLQRFLRERHGTPPAKWP